MRAMSLIVIPLPVIVLLVGALSAAAAPTTRPESPAPDAFDYHQTNVLGTSLDMVVVAPTRADADAAARAVTDEIERLRKILSTYDPAAELARLNSRSAGGSAIAVSPEIVEVLSLYDDWNHKSDGAFSGHLGQLIALYKKAQAENRLPAPEEIALVVKQLERPTWVVDPAAQTVQRLDDQKLFFVMRRPPRSTLLPYATLFRSVMAGAMVPAASYP